MKLVKGKDLSDAQRQEVMRAFVHRGYSIGVGKHYATDDAWIIDHAFYMTKSGRLSLRAVRCEPHYLADSYNNCAWGAYRKRQKPIV